MLRKCVHKIHRPTQPVVMLHNAKQHRAKYRCIASKMQCFNMRANVGVGVGVGV